jgi:hypothetical protein
MARKKVTTYVDEELLRSAKILTARRNVKIYEVFEEALRRYLGEADGMYQKGNGDNPDVEQPRPKVPLLPAGEGPTPSERFS